MSDHTWRNQGKIAKPCFEKPRDHTEFKSINFHQFISIGMHAWILQPHNDETFIRFDSHDREHVLASETDRNWKPTGTSCPFRNQLKCSTF